MSSASQSMLNYGLLEDHQNLSQLGIFPPQTNLISLPLGFNESLKTLVTLPLSFSAQSPRTLSDQSVETKQNDDLLAHFGGSHILSLQKSSPNYWAWANSNDGVKKNGVDDRVGVSTMKMKKIIKARKKVREPRFCFKTMSDVDVLDDGYKWRKYGQKVVKNTQYPRSYYRCTKDECRVKKRVERLEEDPRMVITTYEGRHIHSPSQDDETFGSQAPARLNNFFW